MFTGRMYHIQDMCTAYKAGVLFTGQVYFKQMNFIQDECTQYIEYRASFYTIARREVKI